MSEPGRFQHFAGGDKARRIETELGVLTAARRPFPGAFIIETHTNTDERLDANFFGGADRLLQFFQLLDYDHCRLPQFSPEERDADVSLVLVAVTNDEAFRILVHGEGC